MRKLLQNTLFAAMTAWALYGVQAPTRLRLITMPTGQGSARQHTPQPLQGWPSAGLRGAAG